MYCSNRRGLTPSETLIIAVLVAALGLTLAWRFTGDPAEQERRETIERMQLVMDALERYAMDHGGRFPTNERGLQALMEPPSGEIETARWRGPYIDDSEVLHDAWGAPFYYVAPEGDDHLYRLWSYGANRAEGGTGAEADIQSWNRSTMIP